MLNLSELLTEHHENLKCGDFNQFESDLSENQIDINELGMSTNKDFISGLPLESRVLLKVILYEEHLKEFPYTSDRVNEFERIEKNYGKVF